MTDINARIPEDCARKFKAVRLLGEGGFGQVYLAEQIGLGRSVALKILRTETSQDQEQIKRFVEEGRITAQLSHPNVVRVIDAGAETGVPWLVYELVEGPSLRDRARQQPLRWHEAVHAAAQIAAALEEAHSRSIVHRDVKAENVLQAADGTYKLADFGIAKWAASGGVRTQTGFVIGTPTHLAPELIKGHQPSPASDVYALGVLLYELLTGKLPFDNENLGLLMRSHLEAPVITPTRLQPDLPPDLDQILKKALAKEPSKRISTARDMRKALESVHGAEESDPRRPRPARPPAQPKSGSGTLVTAVESPTAVSRDRGTRATPTVDGGRSILAWLGLSVVAGAALIAAVAVWKRAPQTDVVKAISSPSVGATVAPPDATQAQLLRDADKRVEVARKAVDQVGAVVTRVKEDRVQKGALFEDSLMIPELVDPTRDALGRMTEAIRALDAARKTGTIWHELALSTQAVLEPLRKSPKSYATHLKDAVPRLLKAAQASSEDPFRRDFALIVAAQVAYSERQASGQAELSQTFSRACLTYARSGPVGDPEPHRTNFLHMNIALLAHDHARHAWPSSEPGTSATELDSLRELLGTIAEADRQLASPRRAWLARMMTQVAIIACERLVPFVGTKRARPEELAASAGALSRMIAALPADVRPMEPERLKALREVLRQARPAHALPLAPWESTGK